MLTKNRPFQVACWALMLAFGLSLIVALTDPGAVRMAILAKTEQAAPALGADTLMIADAGQKSPTVDQKPERTAANPTPASEFSARQEYAKTAEPQQTLAATTTPVTLPYDNGPASVESQTVSSSTSQRQATDSRVPRQARTMIVLSPQQLQGESTRSKEVEFLPPPPEVAFADSDHWSDLPATPSLPPQAEEPTKVDVSRQWLEAEIFTLRQEVHRLSEAQQIAEQLDRLQHQQQQLLDMHQNLPVDRLLEVIDLLHQQLTTVRETFPPPPRDPQSTAAVSTNDPTELIGEASTSGTGRLTLKITEAELDDILNLLERLSGTPVGQLPSSLPDALNAGPQLPLPTATKPMEIRPLSFQEEVGNKLRKTTTKSSRCAACHQEGQALRRNSRP